MSNKARVAIVGCADYNPETVYRAINQVFELLGGKHQFFHKRDRILLKPNVLGICDPDKAVTTHPSVVGAVSKAIKEFGAFPEIGESSGCSAFNRTMEAFERAGIARVAREQEVPLVDFDEVETVKVHLPEIERDLLFPKVLFDCNAIVSLPKLKTHSLTGLTGALKNMFGVIPGTRKGSLHREFSNRDLFSKALISILKVVKPRLSIMDAVYGMEGNGPAGGRPKKIGCLIASDDPVALDTVVAERIMKIDSGSLDMIQTAAGMKLGENRLDAIDVAGDFADSFSSMQFQLPVTFYLYSHSALPRSLKKFVAGRIFKGRPVPRITKNCINCGKCVSICPAGAIRMSGVKKRISIDLKKCISCFCCDEACDYQGIVPEVPLSWKLLRL